MGIFASYKHFINTLINNKTINITAYKSKKICR